MRLWKWLLDHGAFYICSLIAIAWILLLVISTAAVMVAGGVVIAILWFPREGAIIAATGALILSIVYLLLRKYR